MKIDQYQKILAERILVFDGAMGTNLQNFNPTVDDYRGLEGCTEILTLARPEWIKKIHADFFAVGCDVVETNSFGANRIVLAEYGLENQVLELNQKAAKIAREAAAAYSRPGKPRLVAGSMGPGTKLPSLEHIPFDTLRLSYAEQAEGLLLGGVDLLLIETCQDLLQIKAAIIGAMEAQVKLKMEVPLSVQVTIESTGTMLLGSDMATAINVIECFPVQTIGLNCATGPTEMSEHVRTLGQLTNRFISVLPNAGLPDNVGGKAVYRLTPEELAMHLKDFVQHHGVNVVGGCCGTTPAHLKKVVEVMSALKPKKRAPKQSAMVTSLYLSTPLRQEPAPLIIGERTNANGSKQFRDLLNAENYDALVDLAKEQEAEGAHVLDVCTAYVGRDEKKDMQETIRRFTLQVKVPLMIDSTETAVMEEALKLTGGKPILNSINLEDGEEKMAQIVALAVKYGAAVVALTIDEEGMAKTADRKVAVAKRLYDLAVTKHGLPPSQILFDTLTFTLGSGEEEQRKAGIETLNAVRRLKKELPECHTLLGVSNVSFGLDPEARAHLNSVFLHHALEAGLDAAIVNFKKIIPLHRMDTKARELARKLIFDERTFDPQGHVLFDPLKEYLSFFSNPKSREDVKAETPKTVEEKLKNRIINGQQQGLEEDLKEALQKHAALDIINSILLEGMKKVGEMFGAGQLQLPFVLQSAETMKAAVRILEPHIPKESKGSTKGKMVLATVKGDVHDIGKNLVDIILTNNGYTVINLGIKQPLENILKAAEEHKPDVIGLSGLLVKSTAVMKENLEEMNKRGLTYQVILGGAALTRKFVEEDLRPLYKGKVFYAQDAFSGLNLMNELTQERGQKTTSAAVTKPGRSESPGKVCHPERSSKSEANDLTPIMERRFFVGHNAPQNDTTAIPTPPFWGTRVVRGIDLKEVFPYINETALLKVRWGFKRIPTLSTDNYEKMLKEKVDPLFEKWKNTVIRDGIFQPKTVYGYFPCQSDGDELVVFENDSQVERIRFRFPRQEKEPHKCIADYFRPLGHQEMDVLPIMLVTIGSEATPKIKAIYEKAAYTDYLYLHGLGVETAEALAEYWHKRIRQELKMAGKDDPNIRGLFQQKYQGSRYSFGYPACPNLEDQTKLFKLLEPARIGVKLSETFQMDPEQSTSALIVHHPEAKYFSA